MQTKGLIRILLNDPKKLISAIRILTSHGPKRIIEKIIEYNSLSNYGNYINSQYEIWFKKNYPRPTLLKTQSQLSTKFKIQPKVSIVTPTYNTNEKFLDECIQSVLNQSYDNWELCLADDCSTNKRIREIIQDYAKKDRRIRYIFRKKNGHISRASNSALGLATGEYVGFLDHDDILWPNALYEVVKILNKSKDAQFIYSDEDKLSEDGKNHLDPFFKPDWNPDYLRSINYITHFAVLKKTLIDKIGGFRTGYEGAQDWDLFLRATRQIDERNIIHISKILYSWRKSYSSTASKFGKYIKKYAFESQKKALKDDLRKRNYDGEILPTEHFGLWRVKYNIEAHPLVSIIIPTKDKFEYMNECLQSILKKTTYKNYELVIVDSGSSDKTVLSFYQEIKQRHKKTKILFWKDKFNFSLVCNFGARQSKGEYLLFLNNDTKVITSHWIENMLEYAQLKETGAVGCKLLYPDGTIQHAGVILGIFSPELGKGVAGHAFKRFLNSAPRHGLSHSIDSIRNFSAVTAACLMISRKKFNLVNGFDPKFRVAFNDVDFCLRLCRYKLRNVYTPFSVLYHHESVSTGQPKSRGRDFNEFLREVNLMHKKWGKLLQQDPYYNPNLSLIGENFNIKC